MLYQLSYSHHAPTAQRWGDPAIIAILRAVASSGLRVAAQPIGRSAATWAATALAVSTSRPGPGTKIVRR